MKKVVFILMGVAIALLLTRIDFQKKSFSGCAFCCEEVLERQVFYRGNGTLALITHKPAVPGHVLIIPERHVERFEELTSDEVRAIGEVIQKVDIAVRNTVGNADYLLIQKNGKGAGQTVPHVHFHYLPEGRFLAIRYLVSPWLKALSQDEQKSLRETLAAQF